MFTVDTGLTYIVKTGVVRKTNFVAYVYCNKIHHLQKLFRDKQFIDITIEMVKDLDSWYLSMYNLEYEESRYCVKNLVSQT